VGFDGIQKYGAQAESCRPAIVKLQTSAALANAFSAVKLFILYLPRGADSNFILSTVTVMTYNSRRFVMSSSFDLFFREENLGRRNSMVQ
jgi:hypothetical protein